MFRRLLRPCPLRRRFHRNLVTSRYRRHGSRRPTARLRHQSAALRLQHDYAERGLHPLIASTVLTDSVGNFSITGKHSWPAPGGLVYLVVIGGNSGLAAGTSNTGIALRRPRYLRHPYRKHPRCHQRAHHGRRRRSPQTLPRKPSSTASPPAPSSSGST